MDIHEYEKKMQSRIRHVKESNLTPKNKELILNFLNDLVLDNLSVPRRMKYVEVLRIMARDLNKDFTDATIGDLKAIIGTIQNRSDFSPWTKQTYKVILRKFFAWMHGMKGKEYPEIVKWINLRINKSECRLPADGDLLTIEDIEKLLNGATHPRDKALIAVLWESGARMSEIGTLTFRKVVYDTNGVVLTVQGKTGSRQIRLVWSVSYLSTWMNVHPHKEDKSCSIWMNIGTRNRNKAMNYPAFRQVVIRLAKDVGITKRIHPHLFRHSRATFMANHLTEFQMNKYFGWIQGSSMPSTYVHMSGKNIDDAILAMNGMKKLEHHEEKKLNPRICVRCDSINAHDTRFCRKCGGAVDQQGLGSRKIYILTIS